MATNLGKILKHIHHLLAPPGGDRTDGELLARFVSTRDEASFAALVRRHGPMVLAVCRRMLRHDQDAEDCFQATFMVLARKAATVKRESVGSWLYAVAYRTSLEARTVNARRRTREKQMHHMPHPEVSPPDAQDWRPWLDQELNRLPEKYRAAIVACDLEGRSRKEAARQLGLAEGTLSSRLARGRHILAKRIAPYGLSLSGASLTAALCDGVASAQVPATLVSITTKAAMLVAAGELAALSVSSTVLMKGVLKSMFVTKLKSMVGALMIVTALGASGLVYRATGQQASPIEKQRDGKPKSELERLRRENELLKLNLEVVLEKVRAQEAELRALKGQPKRAALVTEGNKVTTAVTEGNKVATPRVRVAQEAVERVRDVTIPFQMMSGSELNIQVEPIYKPSSKEELQKALDAMEKALKGLREQLKNEEGQKKGKAKEQSERNQIELELNIRKYAELMDRLKKLQSDSAMWQERATWSKRMSQPGRQYVTIAQAEADEARHRKALFDEAETALKALREARDADSQRKAADALKKAVQKLHGNQKQADGGKK